MEVNVVKLKQQGKNLHSWRIDLNVLNEGISLPSIVKSVKFLRRDIRLRSKNISHHFFEGAYGNGADIIILFSNFHKEVLRLQYLSANSIGFRKLIFVKFE